MSFLNRPHNPTRPSSTELHSCQMHLHYQSTNWGFLTGSQSTLETTNSPQKAGVKGRERALISSLLLILSAQSKIINRKAQVHSKSMADGTLFTGVLSEDPKWLTWLIMSVLLIIIDGNFPWPLFQQFVSPVFLKKRHIYQINSLVKIWGGII